MNTTPKTKTSRRAFVGAMLYVPPTILTLKATPAFASYGSDAPAGSSSSSPFYMELKALMQRLTD